MGVAWMRQSSGAREAPPGVQILSFSCSFQQKLQNNRFNTPILGVGATPPWENPRTATGYCLILKLLFFVHVVISVFNETYRSLSHEWILGGLFAPNVSDVSINVDDTGRERLIRTWLI